jgi:hypothetical protein
MSSNQQVDRYSLQYMMKLCEALKTSTNSVQSNQGPQENSCNISNNNNCDTGNDNAFLDYTSGYIPDDNSSTFMNS